ncbi:hypothetical protein B0E52_12555 [Rhodanobacter sp. C06]|uniref:DUF4190 domain-containing protein n=1 Tax=Rhodanobacter sp. C06 TaxID=1945854 RepID=UPI00098427A2|nr:DUF4190 domain-containing protein [Rhodanobacter sp. C06]OOG39526.1 hypothetical protein B0E52_12555 [Rhodanobacter sp. C06]
MSYQPPASRSTNALAVVSLVFGIAAWCVFPFIGAIVAVVCGHLARGEIRHAPPGSIEGDGMAVAGLVLGYAQLVLSGLFIIVAIGFIFLGFSLHFWH